MIDTFSANRVFCSFSLWRRRQLKSATGRFAVLVTVLSICLGLMGGATPASAQGLFGDGDAQRREAETALRINQLEGQIRNLNGQIEQMGFQLRQLQDQLQKAQKDTDFRLQELEASPRGGARPLKKTELAPNQMAPADLATPGTTLAMPPVSVTPPSPPGSAFHEQEIVPSGTTPMLDGAGAVIASATNMPRQGPGGTPQVLGAPPQILGQIPRSDDPIGGTGTDGQPPMEAAPAPLAPVPGVIPKYANVQPTPSARAEYDAAYGYILNGEYDLAENSFKTFLANHPTDRRAGSAQYWLGETYFQRNMHREATDAFLKGYTQYPDDIKAPDSLLKLGLAYQGLGERKAACNAYDELLTRYPKASKALRDRALAEKNRGKCV